MRRSTLTAFGFAAALALVTTPAFAQHHRDGNGERHESAAPRAEQHESRGESRPAPQAQRQAQPQAQPRPAQRDEQRAAPRGTAPQYATPRYEAPRYAAPRYAAPRYYSGGRYYGPRYYGPAFTIAPRRFYRPYYVFRPRFSVGFGIWAGYPVTYYDPYYYPYGYYPYTSAPVPLPPPGGSVTVQPAAPNQANMGGVSFDITPDSAEIYVDGNYVGQVNQYTATSQPLGLPAGRHHIEIREPGYQVSSFDLDIMAGQVIPFQGQLEP